MAQHKLRSRIAQFKQPFLMGAVTSAALLSGCGGATEGTGTKPDGVIGNPPAPDVGATTNPPGVFWTCPDPAPQAGSSCPTYLEGRECGPEGGVGVRCVSEAWVVTGVTPMTNPPEIIDDCPVDTPTSGAACDEYEAQLSCSYDSDSNCFRQFACTDGEWVDISPTCNPPPPTLREECPTDAPSDGDGCHDYAPGVSCEFDTGLSCFREFVCDEGTWQDVTPPCNPPPPLGTVCPEVLPQADASCEGYQPQLDCVYETDDACRREFRCTENVWQDNSPSCNPPPPQLIEECPTQKPTSDDSCYEYVAGLECEYDTDTSCPTSFRCEGDVWASPPIACNPPPPISECPTVVPAPGDSCDGYEIGLSCSEPSCDGGVGTVCGANGVWEAVVIACNPPAPTFDAGVDSDESGGE